MHSHSEVTIFLLSGVDTTRTTYDDYWRAKETSCCPSPVSGWARPGKARSVRRLSSLAHLRGPTMPERVRFSDAIEPLVQFIEETPRNEILDRTLGKLRSGVPAQTMLTASALAVTRSSDLPPGRHGGPLHPLAGLHAVWKLIGRLPTQYRMEPAPQPDPLAVAALPPRTEGALLEAITQNIHQQPPTDWSTVTNLGTMRAVPEVKETVNLAQQYVQAGYDAEALMRRLGEIVCHDSFTEMHAFKHHRAVVEEFYATREPWRWMHLIGGAQAAAISFGKNMEIYEEALDLLHAA
jgi:hypothetical protein